MNTKPHYSIVVPAFNEASQLSRTLPAMRKAMDGVEAIGELIVVDNNSTDATAEVARRHGATVVFEPVNMIARARNAGGRAARGSALIFIDADTTPSTELLAAALDALERSKYLGGGAVIDLDPPPNWLTRRFAGCWNLLSRQLSYPAGCFFYVQKHAFDAVEGFSESCYASEEIWFARRLKKWGGAQTPKAKLRILPVPVVTSSRKMDNGVKMYGMLLLMLVFPFAVKFRGLCGYWYKRDDAAETTGADSTA